MFSVHYFSFFGVAYFFLPKRAMFFGNVVYGSKSQKDAAIINPPVPVDKHLAAPRVRFVARAYG
jgi:hypothetical protein